MPTNRRRKMRVSNRVPLTFSPEYIAHLKCMDFLGELTEEEIPVAKKLGVYEWDEIVKGWRNKESLEL